MKSKFLILSLVLLPFFALVSWSFHKVVMASPKPIEELQAAVLVMEEGTTQINTEIKRRSDLIAQFVVQNDLDNLEVQQRREFTSKLNECKYALLQNRPCDHQSLLSQVKPLPSPSPSQCPALTSTSSPTP